MPVKVRSKNNVQHRIVTVSNMQLNK